MFVSSPALYPVRILLVWVVSTFPTDSLDKDDLSLTTRKVNMPCVLDMRPAHIIVVL
jgi:hypothetical protein